MFLNGLLVSGACIRVPAIGSTGEPNKLKSLELQHCTLAPGSSRSIGPVAAQPVQPRLIIEMPDLELIIDSSVVGSLRSNENASIHISNSIVDARDDEQKDGKEIAYAGLNSAYGAPLRVENSTIIGRVATRIMELASNTIFYAGLKFIAGDPLPVEAQRLQQGCVRFSYIPPGSRVPGQHHCQPTNDTDAARVRPVFTSLKYGEAAYCQLSRNCAVEITQGADDEAEMGAFHNLYQPQRETNLRTRLKEYLKFGLEAGIFYGS